MIGWKQSAGIVVLATTTLFPLATNAGNDVDRLEALLKELRTLRKAAQTETDAFREEKVRMGYLLEQRRRRLEAIKAETAQIDKANAALQDEVTELRRKDVELKGRITVHRGVLKELLASVCRRMDALPALASEDDRKALAELAKSELPLDQLASAFWSRLLKLANKAVETRTECRQIDIGGRRLQANVLWLGALGAVWMTEDLKQGGVGSVASGQLIWSAASNAGELASIRHAIQVARKAAPASLVVVPLRSKGETK